EVLKRVRKKLARILRMERTAKPPPAGTAPDDPASKSPDLPAARKYLTERRGLPAARVKEMPPAEVLVRYIAGTYRDLNDDIFKATSLPYPESRPVSAAIENPLKGLPDTEPSLSPPLLPALGKVRAPQTRLDRRIAALRVIEAVR